MHVRSRAIRLVTLAALSTILVACGDDSGDPVGIDEVFQGTYTATLTGALTETLSGRAWFGSGTDPETGESAWIAYLVTDAQNPLAAGENVMFFGLGEPQQTGYVLADISGGGEFPEGGAAGMVLTYAAQTLSGAFSSTGGSLTVTSLSSTRMDGTFNFTAEGAVFTGGVPSEGTITVSGSFEAEGGSFLSPFGP